MDQKNRQILEFLPIYYTFKRLTPDAEDYVLYDPIYVKCPEKINLQRARAEMGNLAQQKSDLNLMSLSQEIW